MPRFKVVGNHRVDGVEPGGTVEIEDEGRIAALVVGGHIQPATASRPTRATTSVVEADET